jgi:hypothetical protein
VVVLGRSLVSLVVARRNAVGPLRGAGGPQPSLSRLPGRRHVDVLAADGSAADSEQDMGQHDGNSRRQCEQRSSGVLLQKLLSIDHVIGDPGVHLT